MKRQRSEDGFRVFSSYIEEAGLIEDLRTICLRHRVTLRDIYFDVKGPTVYSARIEAWWWLHSSIRKSTFEIARLFDRDDSTISHAFIKLRARAIELGHVLDTNVFDVAKDLGEKSTKGRAEAMRQNRKVSK